MWRAGHLNSGTTRRSCSVSAGRITTEARLWLRCTFSTILWYNTMPGDGASPRPPCGRCAPPQSRFYQLKSVALISINNSAWLRQHQIPSNDVLPAAARPRTAKPLISTHLFLPPACSSLHCTRAGRQLKAMLPRRRGRRVVRTPEHPKVPGLLGLSLIMIGSAAAASKPRHAFE